MSSEKRESNAENRSNQTGGNNPGNPRSNKMPGQLGEMAGNDNMASNLLAMIELFKRLFSKQEAYRDDPQAQQVTTGIIDSLDHKTQESIENGNYTQGYLFARQKAYFESFHEAAMSPDVTDKDTAVKVATALAEEKIQDLDSKEFAQVAKNDYGDMSESSLAGMHQSVSAEVGQLIDANYAKDARQLINNIIGDDLNKITEEQSATPLSPAEKQNGAAPKQKNDLSSSPNQDLSNDRDIESPSSGPGR